MTEAHKHISRQAFNMYAEERKTPPSGPRADREIAHRGWTRHGCKATVVVGMRRVEGCKISLTRKRRQSADQDVKTGCGDVSTRLRKTGRSECPQITSRVRDPAKKAVATCIWPQPDGRRYHCRGRRRNVIIGATLAHGPGSAGQRGPWRACRVDSGYVWRYSMRCRFWGSSITGPKFDRAAVGPNTSAQSSDLDIPFFRLRFGRRGDFRHLDAIGRIAFGRSKSAARPKSGPDKWNIVQLRVVSAPFRAKFRLSEFRADRGRAAASSGPEHESEECQQEEVQCMEAEKPVLSHDLRGSVGGRGTHPRAGRDFCYTARRICGFARHRTTNYKHPPELPPGHT